MGNELLHRSHTHKDATHENGQVQLLSSLHGDGDAKAARFWTLHNCINSSSRGREKICPSLFRHLSSARICHKNFEARCRGRYEAVHLRHAMNKGFEAAVEAAMMDTTDSPLSLPVHIDYSCRSDVLVLVHGPNEQLRL